LRCGGCRYPFLELVVLEKHEEISYLRRRPDSWIRNFLQVVCGKGRIAYYVPSKETADFAQRARVSISKHNNVLGLKSDDEVFFIAP